MLVKIEQLWNLHISRRIESTIGNIILVVAVFEIHMDKNIVTNMIPAIKLKTIECHYEMENKL